MRILHILDHSTPLHSGYVFRTLSIMHAQRAYGWDPIGLTSPRHEMSIPIRLDGMPDYEEFNGFRFNRTPRVKNHFLGPFSEIQATANRLQQVATEERPDIIHAHSPVLNGLAAIRAGRALGIPVAYEIRAFWEDAGVDLGKTRRHSPKYHLIRWMETQACRSAAHVFTICDGLRQDLIARGIPVEKITIIPNAVDVTRHHPITSKDAPLVNYFGLGDDPVLGFIGSFYAYEGLDLLIEAFPMLKNRFPGLKLLLVGGGPDESRLRQLAAPFGDQIIFAGRVSHDQVNAHYSVIDLLVYPRRSMRLTELVTPLKPLEAMASTRPFIASDIGGHRELIQDGVTGRLFTPDCAESLAETAIEILEAPGPVREALVAKGLEYVRTERNWASCVARYAPVYAALFPPKDTAEEQAA